MEGRLGDLEGSDYECKLRYGLLHWSQRQFGLDNAYLALTQTTRCLPNLAGRQLERRVNGPITAEESEDLYLVDIITSDQGNRHILVEASITLGEDDINRAKRPRQHSGGPPLAVMSRRLSSLRSSIAPQPTKRLPMG